MDPQRGEFELLLARDDTEFSAFDCTLDGRILFLGDNDGNFEMVDTREKADKSNSVNLHDRKLNTLHVSCGVQALPCNDYRHVGCPELFRVQSPKRCTCHALHA